MQKLKLHEGKLSYENANLTAMVNLLQSRLQYLKVKYEITEEDSVIVPPQQYSHGGGDREHAGNKAIEKSSSISRLRRDMYGTLNAANEIVTFLMNMLTLRKKKKVIQVKYQVSLWCYGCMLLGTPPCATPLSNLSCWSRERRRECA